MRILIRPCKPLFYQYTERTVLPMAERLDGIILRIGIPDADVTDVVAALELDTREPSERAIHLAENLSGEPAGLMTTGATAWLERSPGRSRVVVQLRPARRARLSGTWAGFHTAQGHLLQVTEEWMAARRILVATLTASLGPGEPTAMPGHARVTAEPSHELLSARQISFLADCAGLTVLQDPLMLVGPIREQAWSLRRDDLGFRIRRWTAHLRGKARSLDAADLEALASPMDAPFLFPALRSLARQYQVDPEEETSPIAIRALTWASVRRLGRGARDFPYACCGAAARSPGLAHRRCPSRPYRRGPRRGASGGTRRGLWPGRRGGWCRTRRARGDRGRRS
jgi:hypothetical protein